MSELIYGSLHIQIVSSLMQLYPQAKMLSFALFKGPLPGDPSRKLAVVSNSSQLRPKSPNKGSAVDDITPAVPTKRNIPQFPWFRVLQVMQDLYHQQYQVYHTYSSCYF